MRWIVSTDPEISGDTTNLEARREFIHQVTGTDVSEWEQLRAKPQPFLVCTSNDGIDGTFITAHAHEVLSLCKRAEIVRGEFVAANTCVLKEYRDQDLLWFLKRKNPQIDLYYARQGLPGVCADSPSRTVEINDLGTFGFRTSLSERKLFRLRRNGFMPAVQTAFERVPLGLPRSRRR